ncbi:MAG: hypothetical protein V9G12_10340 [Microthrixaceae bacterium]
MITFAASLRAARVAAELTQAAVADLTLPRKIRTAWAPLIHGEGDPTDLVAAS